MRAWGINLSRSFMGKLGLRPPSSARKCFFHVLMARLAELRRWMPACEHLEEWGWLSAAGEVLSEVLAVSLVGIHPLLVKVPLGDGGCVRWVLAYQRRRYIGEGREETGVNRVAYR